MAGVKDTRMIKLEIDGQPVEVPEGTKLIEAAGALGIEIPRYCYHDHLPIEGSCRLCAVEIEGNPKLQLSCATPVAEGMKVKTDTERVKKSRQGVLEFLLLNHPLDCPICDKAGECPLQNYYFAHSAGDSRLSHAKWHKHKRVELGETIVMDEERCILCGRCVRFMDNVAKQPVLGRFNRGSHTELSVMPGEKLDNPYSLNTVDICPVGALTSRDFRFRQRTWFLKATRSVCPGCATGCNMNIEQNREKVYRLRPVRNEEINQVWMCDAGRLLYHRREDAVRPEGTMVDGSVVNIDLGLARFQERFLGNSREGKLLIIASHHLTLEEAWLTFRLAEATDATVLLPELTEGFVGNTRADDLLENADKSPNREGLKRVAAAFRAVKVVESQQATEFLASNKFAAMLLIGEDLTDGLDAKAQDTLREIPRHAAITWSLTPFVQNMELILAARHLFEKNGCFINGQKTLQRVHAAVAPTGYTEDDVTILAQLLALAGHKNKIATAADAFMELREKLTGLAKLKFNAIPVDGVKL